MSRVTRGAPAGEAYLDLQNAARRSSRPTQELLQLYVLEGFLARLSASNARKHFVLKGGVLLAAFDSRRPTACVEAFAARGKRGWPPTLAAQPHWPVVYTRALEGLEELGLAADVEVAVARVQAFIERIESTSQGDHGR